MKDFDRILRAYEAKPMKRLKALKNKHHANYITFWKMKAELNRFGLHLPEFEERHLYYWRLTNLVGGLYHQRERELKKLSAPLPAKPTHWQLVIGFIRALLRPIFPAALHQ